MKDSFIFGHTTVDLQRGDILSLDVDAVINPANTNLDHGGGLAGQIVHRGGDSIQEESDRIGHVPVGGAAMTGAGTLRARHVIHAVGPRMGEGDEDRKLAAAITSVLTLATEQGLRSLSIPAISAGIFGFPKDRCARILVGETARFLAAGETSLQMVEFCIFDREAYGFFQGEMEKI